MKTQRRTTRNNVPTVPAPLTRRKMSDAEVLNMITPYYPMFAPLQFFETMVFELLDSWCDDYDGGVWSYFKLSNGAWYLAPADEGIYRVKDYAGGEHEMIPDGAGLTATLYMLHRLTWHFHEAGDKAKRDVVSEHYHALRMYTYPHPDATAIWRVLD